MTIIQLYLVWVCSNKDHTANSHIKNPWKSFPVFQSMNYFFKIFQDSDRLLVPLVSKKGSWSGDGSSHVECPPLYVLTEYGQHRILDLHGLIDRK